MATRARLVTDFWLREARGWDWTNRIVHLPTPPVISSSARFITPMLLQRTDSLPNNPQWLDELKHDGYRVIAIKRGGMVHLRSRNDNDFSGRYPGVVKGLAKMPDDTVIDGEVIAFDDDGG